MQRLIATIALCSAFATCSASAATVSYTLTGGAISGSLDGTAFNATGFTITATASTTNIISGNLFDNGPSVLNAVTPTIHIFTVGGATLNATLEPTPGFSWMAAAVDFTGSVAHGFILFDSFATPIAGGLGSESLGPSSSNLADTGSYSGQLIYGTTNFSSSSGPLFLDIPESVPGSFTISAVPEPGTSSATLLAGFAAISLIFSRRRP